MDYANHPRASKKLTLRKAAVYVSALILLGWADPRLPSFVVGCVLCALAWMLRVWAFAHLEKNQTMITTGPYAHTRNPAYFGSFLALTGIVLAAGNWETSAGRGIWAFGLLLEVVFFTVYLPRKFKREYPRLRALFGEQLELHAAHVPDFWPRIKPWRSGDDRRFSWGLVSANHEWSWGLVLTLGLAAVWTAPLWSPWY